MAPAADSYAQVRVQMPLEKFEPVVGMTEQEIREEMERPRGVKVAKSFSDNDEDEMMQKVNAKGTRSIHSLDREDTLESIIEWVNGEWAEESPLQNVIVDN